MSNLSHTGSSDILTIKWNQSIDHLAFDLSLPLNTDQPLYIQGENGVGKTSLLNHLKKHRKLYWNEDTHINFVDQGDPEILEDLSLSNVIALIKSRVKRELNNEFEHLRNEFKTEFFWNKPFYQLSGGQKQIAKILIGNIFKASVYIFDEPFLNLDKKNKTILKKYLKFLIEKKHNLIITEHNGEFIPEPFYEIELKKEDGVVTICR